MGWSPKEVVEFVRRSGNERGERGKQGGKGGKRRGEEMGENEGPESGLEPGGWERKMGEGRKEKAGEGEQMKERDRGCGGEGQYSVTGVVVGE